MHDADFVIVGSGFGGSVAALRLAEKGYRVTVLEKGRRFAPEDFPTSNWQLPRWMWAPRVGWRGPFKMTFMRHQTVLSGVGVGGGSLIYGCTLPVPKDRFFTAESWAHLADWKRELAPFYDRARTMLGVAPNPRVEAGDEILRRIAREHGREDAVRQTDVGVFFGEAGATVADPYFGGRGPARAGCRFCAGCMLGCRHNAKNTLDRNYLYLAEGLGASVRPECEVTSVRPLDGGGYVVGYRDGAARERRNLCAANVVFAGGVMGTVPLLLTLKRRDLSRLSDRIGFDVRTNSESLIQVTTLTDKTLAEGLAITSIYEIDEESHVELVRYPPGSNFFSLATAPHAEGGRAPARLARAAALVARHPGRYLRAAFRRDPARHAQILLFMQTTDSTLRLKRGLLGGVRSARGIGRAPTASIAQASKLARAFERESNGVAFSMLTETLFGIPTTAHILGGCVMGRNAREGVIDRDHRLFGYDGLYVVDGSAVSANPGVNPSLTITALAERAMAKIPAKNA